MKVCAWRDGWTTRQVTLLSTYLVSTPKRYDRKKKTHIDVDCHAVVGVYITNMGGIDLFGMMSPLYKRQIKSRRCIKLAEERQAFTVEGIPDLSNHIPDEHRKDASWTPFATIRDCSKGRPRGIFPVLIRDVIPHHQPRSIKCSPLHSLIADMTMLATFPHPRRRKASAATVLQVLAFGLVPRSRCTGAWCVEKITKIAFLHFVRNELIVRTIS